LVNGEWIATLDETKDFYDEDGYRWVKISIKGKVRELTKIPFTPETYTLSCSNKKCSTDVFNNGQELIVYFKAPNNGYVTIFLDDTNLVQVISNHEDVSRFTNLPYEGPYGDLFINPVQFNGVQILNKENFFEPFWN
jgi:hypothetical protein